MPVLSNPRHEKFAQLVASGLSALQAYTNAGYRQRSAKGNATRFKENDGIARRIAEIQTENDHKSAMTRDELIGILVGFIRDESLRVWPHRIKAAELLAKMCRWTERDENIKVQGDPLQALIDSIRARVADAPPIRQLPP
jgi:phage terminase small subunit